MSTLLWLIFWLGGLIALGYFRASLIVAVAAIGAGLLITTLFSDISWFSTFVLWAIYGGSAFVLLHPEYKKRLIINPLFDAMNKNLPTMSNTEQVALEAGTVSWDGELFSGHLQWEKLLTIPTPKLTEEEKQFLEGPVKTLCEMTNDWEIVHLNHDLSQEIWDYIKAQGFFALIIPKKYGGKGFSEYAHSEILSTLASRSLTLASTIAVPNSLGPAELLLHYGTPEQRDHYLPRLASGEDIPCFALTGPNAGSDAGAITDFGIVCKQQYKGKETLGIKLNWDKRYITLAPIATILGLAFKLYDPDHLLGGPEEIGITCALIPTTTTGVSIGRRHLPSLPFQNGPTQGTDVFIPLDWIIGGERMAGQGWRMLVECLSTGRAISLPSISGGGALAATMATGIYARIRRQFRTPLASFEGIQEVLGRMGGFTYLSQATRQLTVSMIDAGERPSVPGAISKYHVTELSRIVANDAMDIHGGKGIMMGPKNYLSIGYQGIPIAITVEGANILTRNMIIFGQGAVRCHPFILKEMHALHGQNIQEFEHLLGQHTSYTITNCTRAFFHGLTHAYFAKSPVNHFTKPYFKQLERASHAYAFVSDAAMAMLGGKLKFKESISARLGDMLAMMYIVSAVLKRFQDDGSNVSDQVFVTWSVRYCLDKFWQTMSELLSNLPNVWAAGVLRFLVMPLGVPKFAIKDKLNREITEILTTPSETHKRLFHNVFISKEGDDNLALLVQAFNDVTLYGPILKKLYEAVKHNEKVQGSLKLSIDTALQINVLTEEEANTLYTLDAIIQRIISVDDFDAVVLAKGLQPDPQATSTVHQIKENRKHS